MMEDKDINHWFIGLFILGLMAHGIYNLLKLDKKLLFSPEIS